MRLNEYLTSYSKYLLSERNLAFKTVELRVRIIRQFLHFKRNKPFNLLSVREYLHALDRRNRAASTRNTYILAIRSFARYMLRVEHKLEFREVLKIRSLKQLPTDPVFLTVPQLQMLVAPCIDGYPKVRETYNLIIKLQIHTAARNGEILKLKLGNLIELKKDEYYLELRKGKTGDRRVSITRELAEEIKDFAIKYDRKLTQDLFVSRLGKPITNDSYNDELKKRGRALGISKELMHTHAIRHGRLTHLASENLSTQILKNISGHKKSEMLEKYIHLAGGNTKVLDDYRLF